MRSGALCVAALAGLLWASAVPLSSSSVQDGSDPDGGQQPQNQQPSRSIDPQTAIAHWRQVALLNDGTGSCPTVARWSVETPLDRLRPFQDDESHHSWDEYKAVQQEILANLALMHSLGLDRFCIYQADEGSSSPFPPLASIPGLAAVAPDRMALAPAAEPEDSLPPLAAASWDVLSAHFLEQTGSTSATGERLRFGGRPSVRLVFLDTEPTGPHVPSAPGYSFHGYTMAHLANQLVCAGERNCAIQITTRLAMPYRAFSQRLPPAPVTGPEDGAGGNIGLLDDLSAAILEEVGQWRRDRRRNGPKHLVLNLSLGWDGELFGDLEARRVSELEPPVRQVYLALKLARKLGVLVIAAAGNQRGGPDKPTSPLFPAVWELRRPSPFPFPLGRKLVYAAGGVDWQGLPIANARTGGKPRRSTYADHAVTGTSNAGTSNPTWIYTGTSVGAAVTSSIAAAVWHHRPELGPGQVMKRIGRSGDRLQQKADFYPWQQCRFLSWLLGQPSLRRVSLCRAVAAAQGLRPEEGHCPRWEPEPPVLDTATPDPGIRFAEGTWPAYEPRCAVPGPFMISGSSVPADACPAERFGDIGSQRWIFPQPPNNPCMGCSLVPGGDGVVTAVSGDGTPYTLQMELSTEWQAEADGAVIEAATLEIRSFEHDQLVTFDIPRIEGSGKADGQILTTSLRRIPIVLPYPLNLRGCTARLNFKVTKDASAISIIDPVIVDP